MRVLKAQVVIATSLMLTVAAHNRFPLASHTTHRKPDRSHSQFRPIFSLRLFLRERILKVIKPEDVIQGKQQRQAAGRSSMLCATSDERYLSASICLFNLYVCLVYLKLHLAPSLSKKFDDIGLLSSKY